MIRSRLLTILEDLGQAIGRPTGNNPAQVGTTTYPGKPTRPAYEAAEPMPKELPGIKHKWGMAIDLDRCVGCGACIVACRAENNQPVVGDMQCDMGRIFEWIRVEREIKEIDGETKVTFQPLPCQHCDNAPCEPVCPVYATYHTDEGLNTQIYNRCVGTRYCGNNCPYTVRFFNFYKPHWDAPLDAQLNPDLIVRPAGVMEKCTFCIQRIRRGKENAQMERRRVKDGEIVPACAQTCPADAIVFGDMLDENSRVAKLALSERKFRLLEHLGTSPAVFYLSRG